MGGLASRRPRVIARARLLWSALTLLLACLRVSDQRGLPLPDPAVPSATLCGLLQMGFPPSFDCGPQQLHRNLRGGAAVAPQDATPPLLGHRAQGVRFDDEDEDETEELLRALKDLGI